jgi:choline kinase
MWKPTRAVILAAGNGTRMGTLTADRPKAMLDVNGRSLVERSLDALNSCGIGRVTIVAGYQQQRLREHVGARARFVDNTRYRDTNSLYSLFLARHELLGGAVIMNSDILSSPALVRRLVDAPADDAVLIDTTTSLHEEEMKVQTWCGLAIDFGKDLVPRNASGENVGILKFSPSGARRLVAHLDALVAAGDVNAWAPQAFRAFAQESPLRAVDTGGIPWTEIDFPEDLQRACEIAGGLSHVRA